MDPDTESRIAAIEAEILALKARVAQPAAGVPDDEVDYGWLVDSQGGGGGSGVKLVGTDESESESDEFTFASADDSNIDVKVDDETRTVTIGAYWK